MDDKLEFGPESGRPSSLSNKSGFRRKKTVWAQGFFGFSQRVCDTRLSVWCGIWCWCCPWIVPWIVWHTWWHTLRTAHKSSTSLLSPLLLVRINVALSKATREAAAVVAGGWRLAQQLYSTDWVYSLLQRHCSALLSTPASTKLSRPYFSPPSLATLGFRRCRGTEALSVSPPFVTRSPCIAWSLK